MNAGELPSAIRRKIEALAPSRVTNVELVAADHPDNMALLGAEWLIREKCGG